MLRAAPAGAAVFLPFAPAARAPAARRRASPGTGRRRPALSRAMRAREPRPERLSRERWLLAWELAELHARAEAARSQARWWRQEARATREETGRLVAQARALVAASRR